MTSVGFALVSDLLLTIIQPLVASHIIQINVVGKSLRLLNGVKVKSGTAFLMSAV